jgi:hypothetical protein
MRQLHDPEDFHEEDLDRYDDEEDLEEFGTPLYQGSGLSVRALTAEELQRFLDAHHDQPAQLLGSGWAALDPPGHPLGGPRTSPAATLPAVPAEVTGGLGSPGRSALAAYRRRRGEELAAWSRTLAWRAPLVATAGAVVQVLATQAGACHTAGCWAWGPPSSWAGGCGFGPPSGPTPGSAAPKGSGAPPACWSGSPATGTWSSTTWPCPTRTRMWIIW